MTADLPTKSAVCRASQPALWLSVVSILLMSTGQTGQSWLRYDRAAIHDGEIWRLLTGHLVHLGWPHLAMNLAGLWLIWLLYGRLLTPLQWLTALLATASAISLALLVADPGLDWYVGLSGVLHGFMVTGIIVALYRHPLTGEWLLLALITIKLGWEQLHGSLPGSAELAGGPVVVDAHLYGALAGLPLGFWFAHSQGGHDRHGPGQCPSPDRPATHRHDPGQEQHP